jgi:hypothetical protein
MSLRHQSDVMSDTFVDYYVAPTSVIDASVQSYQLGRSHGFLTFWFDSHVY